jgi:signal peptidase I
VSRRRIAVVALVLGALVAGPAAAQLRSFYVASESMEPTMTKGDRFFARMNRPDPLSRGDIVLVETANGDIYIQRVAGLPGDRIEIVDGAITLNGQTVERRFVRADPVAFAAPERTAQRLAEQFPGEAQPHEIYDTGPSAGDDVAPLLVPPGHLFLLGDNRDHSADSRFPARAPSYGVGMAPIETVRGVPMFFYSQSRFGQSAAH